MNTIHDGVSSRDSVKVRYGWIVLLRQIRERPRLCVRTLGKEKLLYELAFCNGLFSLINPGGFSTIWRYAGLVMPQQGYGLVTTLFAFYAAFAYWHGSLALRAWACVGGIVIAGVVGVFIGMSNPYALPLPVFACIVGQRILILWDMALETGRAHAAPD